MSRAIPLPQTYIISISGPTASGKTTLARLLRQTFDGLEFTPANTNIPVTITASILHQDDFYVPEDEIPIKSVPKVDAPGEFVEQADWDCIESIDFTKLKCCLQRFRQEGCNGAEGHARILREIGIEAKEETNSVGPARVTEAQLRDVRGKTLRDLVGGDPQATSPNTALSQTQTQTRRIHVLFLEGFLLYFNETLKRIELPPLISLFDIRLFLHTTLEYALLRRKARMSYVTVAEFFDDPPGYIENIVWPSYVKYHQHLFTGGDVEQGQLNDWARQTAGIKRQEREEMDMRDLLEWGARLVAEVIVTGM